MNVAFEAQSDGSVVIKLQEGAIMAAFAIPGQDSEKLLTGLTEEFRKAKAIATALTPEAPVTKRNGKGKVKR